jgi:hypothetical protein
MNRRPVRERGAVTTVVATLLLGGMIFGFLAIAVDYGQLMYERAQQQNSADASALSLARSCGKGASTCVTNANSLGTINNANSFDNQNSFQSQCGVNLPAGSTLPDCTAAGITSDGSLTNCSPLPAGYAAMTNLPYVEVRTKTQASGLRNWFAQLNGGSSTSSVGACSRAAWGYPIGGGGGALPIAISGCDWMRATGGTPGGGGGQYFAAPVYTGATTPDRGYGGAGQPAWPQAPCTPPLYTVGQEVTRLLQGTGSGTPACPAPPSSGAWSGHALPSGFGTVKTVSGQPCQADVKAFHWAQSDTGNNTACDLAQFVGKVVNVPIFDCTHDSQPAQEPPIGTCTAGNGSNAWYHLQGYASFYLSGYSMNVTGGITNKVQSVNPNFGAFPCNGGDRCISGWFTTGSLSATAIGGSTNQNGYYGTYTVVPAG